MRRIYVYLAAFLVLPVVAADHDDLVDVRIEEPPDTGGNPPEGYYFHAASDTWYYYNGGVLLTPQPAGFEPPVGERTIFTLLHIVDDTDEGFQLRIKGKFLRSGVNATTIYYRIEYAFDREGVVRCAHRDGPPEGGTCVGKGAASSYQTNPLQISGFVLEPIDRTVSYEQGRPHVGFAEAWGWLDRNTTSEGDKNQRTYHAQRISW